MNDKVTLHILINIFKKMEVISLHIPYLEWFHKTTEEMTPDKFEKSNLWVDFCFKSQMINLLDFFIYC